MNSKINSTSIYHGNISLKYIYKDKIIDIHTHNAGCPGLFRILTKALAGYDTRGECPVKIMVKSIGTDNTETELLTHDIYLTSSRYYQHDDDPLSWSTYYTAVVSYKEFNSINLNNGITAIKLVLRSALNEDLATAALSIDELGTIQSGGHLMITWRLSFSNDSDKEFSENTDQQNSDNDIAEFSEIDEEISD